MYIYIYMCVCVCVCLHVADLDGPTVCHLRIRQSKSFATTSTSRCGEGGADFEWMRLQTFGDLDIF